MKNNKHILQWLLILVVFFVISRAIAQAVGVEEIRTFVDQYPILAPFVIVVIKSASVIFAPLSGTATYVIAGTLFPIREWMLYMTIGNLIGICTTYYLWHKFWLTIIRWMFGASGVEQAHSIIDRIRKPKTFIIARFVLFPLEDLINYVAGMAKTPFWIYLITSLLASSLLALVFVLSTAGLISLNI